MLSPNPSSFAGENVTAAARSEIDRELRSFIREIPNFPKPGIDFKDITPLLANAVSQLDYFRGETRNEGPRPVAIPSWIVVRDRQNAHGGVQKVAPARVAIQGAEAPALSSGGASALASGASR